MREHNSWVRNSEMGNAQEAIEDYENQNDSARRLDAVKIVTTPTNKTITIILDHEYSDNGDCRYQVQRYDRLQKWVKPPAEYSFEWLKLIKQYWSNQTEDKDPPTWDDPDAYL